MAILQETMAGMAQVSVVGWLQMMTEWRLMKNEDWWSTDEEAKREREAYFPPKIRIQKEEQKWRFAMKDEDQQNAYCNTIHPDQHHAKQTWRSSSGFYRRRCPHRSCRVVFHNEASLREQDCISKIGGLSTWSCRIWSTQGREEVGSFAIWKEIRVSIKHCCGSYCCNISLTCTYLSGTLFDAEMLLPMMYISGTLNI